MRLTSKKKTVKKLKELARECDNVIIATDIDREGEAIEQTSLMR